MEIHNHFTNVHYVIVLTIFVITNLVVLRLKKQNWKALVDWKVISLAVIITLLGLLYNESSKSNDWLIETSGFPKHFYLKKSSVGSFVSFGIMKFNIINLIQNFTLFYFLTYTIFLIFNRKK